MLSRTVCQLAVIVIVDGGWSKHKASHAQTLLYNAQSRVAIIIGKLGKILHMEYAINVAPYVITETPLSLYCFQNWNGSSRTSV